MYKPDTLYRWRVFHVCLILYNPHPLPPKGVHKLQKKQKRLKDKDIII